MQKAVSMAAASHSSRTTCSGLYRFRCRVIEIPPRPLRALGLSSHVDKFLESKATTPDATNWVRASNFPELFTFQEHSEKTPRGQPVEIPQEKSQPADQPTTGHRWWYLKNGAHVGPVDQDVILQALNSESLTLDDLVWAEGMPQWVAVRDVPELSTALARPPKLQTSAEPPESLGKAAATSKPWVVFITIGAFTCAGFSIFAGLFALLFGAYANMLLAVAWGYFLLILGLDCAAGGFILLNYANRLASLQHDNHPVLLEKALDALTAYWMFVSLNIIAFLAINVLIIIGCISALLGAPLYDFH